MKLPALLAVILALAACLPAQTTRYRDMIFPRAAVQTDLIFGSALNSYTQKTEILKLDLYLPQGDTATSRPAMVIVHGGGFKNGDKATGQFRKLAQDFARRGFIAISINYRLRKSGSLVYQNVVDAAHDMKAAVRWLHKNKAKLKLDPDRIGCIGGSAGAITCCEAAYVPGEGKSGNPGHPSRLHAVVDLWGFLWDPSEMEIGEAPVIIVHGTKDPAVPYQRSIILKQRADLVGVPAELHPIQDGGHGPWGDYFSKYHAQHTIAFLWESLKLAQISGLGARSGYQSPGRLTIDSYGIAKDSVVLIASAGQSKLSLPPWGILYLDMQSSVPLPTLQFAASPRLPAATNQLTIPGGLKGSIHWQAVQFKGTAPRILTNAVTTNF